MIPIVNILPVIHSIKYISFLGKTFSILEGSSWWWSNPVQARCTWYNKVCQWLAAGRCFFPGTPVSSTNTTDRHEITDILLKVALNTITITYFRSGAAIIVELSEWNASINLTIYQVYVSKAQYAMQILKGKYLAYKNCIRS